MNQEDISRMVSLFYEIASLRYLPRSHRHVLLTHDNTDTIAAHSGRVPLFGYFIAKALGADAGKVMLMCSMHDLSETRSGDQHWLHKNYVKVDEERIWQDQFSWLPFVADLAEIRREYKERVTLEAQITKDADYLDQIFLLCEYAHQGNEEARRWLKGGLQIARMKTQLAKDLALEAQKQLPSAWWQDSFTPVYRDD